MDLKRYQGLWYEIAKFPYKWEIFCDTATAYYNFDEVQNVLNIENTCWNSGKNVGSRNAIGLHIEPFLLKVIFNDGLPNDGWGDYLIEYTDYDNYAIVGSPSKENLWILARKQQITYKEYMKLLNIVSNRGYDLNKLKINKV